MPCLASWGVAVACSVDLVLGSSDLPQLFSLFLLFCSGLLHYTVSFAMHAEIACLHFVCWDSLSGFALACWDMSFLACD